LQKNHILRFFRERAAKAQISAFLTCGIIAGAGNGKCIGGSFSCFYRLRKTLATREFPGGSLPGTIKAFLSGFAEGPFLRASFVFSLLIALYKIPKRHFLRFYFKKCKAQEVLFIGPEPKFYSVF
jgi:hypothetical protein